MTEVPEGRVRLRLDSSNVPDLQGARAVVEVLNHGLQVVERSSLELNKTLELALRSGVYAVRVNLPSGLTMTESVLVKSGKPAELRLSPQRPSAQGWFERQAVLKPAPIVEIGDLTATAYESLWMRLWARDGDQWDVVAASPEAGIASNDAVRFALRLPEAQHLLQVGARSVPWKFVALPAGTAVDVVMRPTASSTAVGHPILVDVTSDHLAAESLLGFLLVGNMRAAREVAAGGFEAEWLSNGEVTDPIPAAVAGYCLLRLGELDRLREWSEDLATRFDWMADGAIIHAWRLIRGGDGQVARLDALVQARAWLLTATGRGLPIYSEGLRLLLDGLRLFGADAEEPEDGGDDAVVEALARMRRYSLAAQHGVQTVTFAGAHPDQPTPEAIVGLPEDRTNLVLLRDVPMTGRWPVIGGWLRDGVVAGERLLAGRRSVRVQPVGDDALSRLAAATAIPVTTGVGRFVDLEVWEERTSGGSPLAEVRVILGPRRPRIYQRHGETPLRYGQRGALLSRDPNRPSELEAEVGQDVIAHLERNLWME
jgi:hypothetical protein